MMRIALLTELYPPSIGGQELFFEGLGRALVEHGHSVEVFCVGHAAGLPAREIVHNITIHRFPSDPHYKTPAKAWMKRAWPSIFRYAAWTRLRLQLGEYDLVVLNQWPLLHAVTLPRDLRRRSVLHWCEIREGRFYGALQKWLPRLVTHNAAISDGVASEIRRTSGRPIFTMPSGLRLGDYGAAPQDRRSGVLSLGRIVEHKNLPLLVRCFDVLKRRGYPGGLTIAGEGPTMPDLRRTVAASPFAADIALLGPVSDAEKAQLLAQSDLLVLTSQREGFPRVVAEAMASGLPVLTAAYPGNGTKEVVREAGCGLVAEPLPASLADAAQSILDAWETFSHAGSLYAEKLDWGGIAERLEQQVGWKPARSIALPGADPSHAC
ncbi:glycosyltransferase family 4 protein [Kaistia terrae]|uniref:Glycosyltransferase family 4 protein n=1 Tax=Kaistia terrae TaxID=537017 RepID=A0ABW0Q370_9HYPH|nr:glycosyltransferase [Kaistia terrae]MCX5580538.1 glycosyltransferase [Kaistia terrae]